MAEFSDRLDDVLAAAQAGAVIPQPSVPTVHLLSPLTMSVADAPRIRKFLSRAQDALDMKLVVVGGGYGCTRLIITVEAPTEEEAFLLVAELLSNDEFASEAVEEGFKELLRPQPYAHKTLATGVVQGEIPNDGPLAFISYAHPDEAHRVALTKHLSVLVNQKLLRMWHDRKLELGDRWLDEIERAMDQAQLFLILVSADYLSSDFCRDTELARALSRHSQGLARLVPIIVRPVDWEHSVLGELQAVPTGAKPITKWQDTDEAWTDVAKHIRTVVRMLRAPGLGGAAAY
jgi:hypothetical protein